MTAPEVRTSPARGTHAEDSSTQNGPIVSGSTCLDKSFAPPAAQLALLGFGLHGLALGGFRVAKRNRTAHCSDLGAVAQFLRLIGGAR